MLGKELADCWLKIGRAEEHSKTVSDEICDWENAKPYLLVKNRDAKGSRYNITVNFTIPYRDRWSLIAGDCIHNLRSALDHLIYGVALSLAKVSPPPDYRRLQFPIADSPEEFAGQKWRIESLGETVGANIKGVQPYNRRHPLLPPLLSIIRDFDDCDKHRLLNIAISRQQSGEAKIDCPIGHIVQTVIANPNDIINGAEIMAFTIDPPLPDVKYQYETSLTIGFCHASGPTGVQVTSIRTLLPLLCKEVRTVVEIVGRNI
jgi:hypothetical protein